MPNVPIIDFARWRDGSAEEKRQFAEELGQVCHRVGFFHLVNHGIDIEFQEKIKSMMRDLFRLPLHEKEKISKTLSPHFRGWEALGTERTNGRVDYREQVDTWTDRAPRAEDPDKPYMRLYGPSQYFEDSVLPGYRALTREWFARCTFVSDALLDAMAVALGLEENFFRQKFGASTDRMSLTKWIYYPGSKTGQHGVNAHKDTGFLTLLLPDGPGLEVQHQNGAWLPVQSVPGAFVVNLGEILQSLTGQYFVATPHRVVTSRERYSCAYFHGPHLDFQVSQKLKLDPKFEKAVAASPFHRNAKFMARKEETAAGVGDMGSPHIPNTYGEQLWNYFSRAYPDIVQSFYPRSRL